MSGAPPSTGPGPAPGPLIGASLPRREDDALLRGAGCYLEDVVLEGMAHAAIVRSPHAHARILGIDLAAARAAPGVLGAWSGDDLVAAGIRPLPCFRPIASADGTPFAGPERRALAVGTVRHVGDPVALVVAETEAAARDGAELVEVDYEALPACVEPEASTERAFLWEKGDRGAVDAAFAAAAQIVEARLVNPRIIISPLETRGAIGLFDAATGTYTLRTQTQGVHLVRRAVAPTLDVPEERLRVLTDEVGGSFGLKLVAFPEQTLVCFAARATGRPVRWISSRAEGHLSDTGSRDNVSRVAAAFDGDLRVTAIRIASTGNLGGYASTLAPSMHTLGFSSTVGGPYAVPAMHVEVSGVYTHTPPTDAMRGSGKPESTYLFERLLDRLARRTGIDRLELRRRNLVPPERLPWTAPTGITFDSGNFPALVDRAAALADWAGFAARRAESEARGRRRGIGIGLYLHMTGIVPMDMGRVTLATDGTVLAATGQQSAGQGHLTTLAQLVADRLELPLERVRIIAGDSDVLPRGSPTAGSSSIQVGGTALVAAAGRLLDAARREAGRILEAAEADIGYGSGRFTILGTDRGLDLAALAAELAADDLPACAGEAEVTGSVLTTPTGAYVAEVELDPETGAVTLVAFHGVDDLGRRLNPPLALGQLRGGVAQGIGAALLERAVWDPESGQLLSGSLMDYALPRADDLPMLVHEAADVPTPNQLLGMKGAGEVGCLGAPGAVANAVADALGHDDIDIPATPEATWRALNL